MTISSGTRLGRYKIRSHIGTGGMGEVYLAQDTQLDRTVALKILPDLASDQQRMLRFIQEAKAASALNHPNIITIHEIGAENGQYFIATEFIEGETLRERMTRLRLRLTEVLDIAIQVASALSAAHVAGIVHRDIKPENIMLRRDGYVKVLDFGLAKLTKQACDFDATTLVLTEPGLVMGTVNYMSPEQARGLEVDARTDIWSFGVVLYEIIAGCAPFKGATLTDILVSILESEPESLSQYSNEVPAELNRILSKALAKDLESRYQKIDDLACALKSIKEELEFEAKLKDPAHSSTSTRANSNANSLTDTAVINYPNNLSSQLPTLIGRTVEENAIKSFLLRSDVRLLTLTGVGGTGKTRLAQQVSRDLLRNFKDGVFFIALAPIANHNLVASTIAETLGVKEAAGSTFAESLKEYLHEKNVLLVLDNFEQVIDATPLAAGLLATCSHLKLLITSRRLLSIGYEREFQVPSLTLPQPDTVESAEDLMQYGASALFVQRLRDVKPQFAVTDENARTIAEICIRLDGLPLAIELAVARIKVLSLGEMLERLDHRLNLLKSGARDLPARQQTMRATIAWSYDLLGEQGKTLCRRLSVFAGGSTVKAAGAVCGAINGEGIDVLDELETLVNESLVLKKETADGSYRFLMLETIREYGLEQLERSGEREVLRRRHANFFFKLAEGAERHLMSAAREPWLERLDAEHNNLRAALRWAADNGESELGLSLAGALRWFWYHRGYLDEGRRWSEHLLSLPGSSKRTKARAKGLYSAGCLAYYMGDVVAARLLLQESAAIWRDCEDTQFLAYSLIFLALATGTHGLRADTDRAGLQVDPLAARSFSDESISLFRKQEDKWGLAMSLLYRGIILFNKTIQRGEIEARPFLEESRTLYEELGDPWGLGATLYYLGVKAQRQGDTAEARALYEESLSLFRESGDKWRSAIALYTLGDLLRAAGEYGQARTLLGESLMLYEKLGNKPSISQCRAALTEMAN